MLCQRVKKELFETEAEYLAALAAHHAVLAAAVLARDVGELPDVAKTHRGACRSQHKEPAARPAL